MVGWLITPLCTCPAPCPPAFSSDCLLLLLLLLFPVQAHEGMVTETQFLRVLAAVDLVPHRDDERRCLLDYFRGIGIKAHMIDYRAFLAAVEGAVP